MSRADGEILNGFGRHDSQNHSRSDLLIKGGNVFHGGRIVRADITVHNGVIAAVTPSSRDAGAAPDAREVVDATGLLVTPGLVDMHTHVHAGGSYWGLDPDPVAWHSGVTTWVDAGSSGAFTFEALRRSIAGYGVRVPVLLNISAIGLAGPVGEALDTSLCDVDLAVATARANPGLVRGFKVRMDRHNASGLEPLRRAIEAGAACGLPVMVHIGAAPPTLAELLPLLRPGDIITHCASGIASAGDAGVVREAYQAGVVFDLGHGSGGFAFDVLEAQLAEGMVPHAVSTDLHARSVHGPAFDLPTTMAKMLACGMSLEQVLAATTIRPAQVLGLTAGTLDVGAPADIAVFEVDEGDFEVADVHGQRRRSPLRLRNRATFHSGRLLQARLPQPSPPWIPLTPAQRSALARREQAVRDLFTTPLVGADDLTEQFSRNGGKAHA